MSYLINVIICIPIFIELKIKSNDNFIKTGYYVGKMKKKDLDISAKCKIIFGTYLNKFLLYQNKKLKIILKNYLDTLIYLYKINV